MESKTLTPAEYDKIVAGLKKATDSIQMLRGKPTSHTAKADTTDEDAAKIYEQYLAEQRGTE
ncbi:hypothetical protein [Rhodococcus sp. 1168]|uniref:hypothetical protein n=1 Tax=Rhodococcus sp. 1168 TaxID=2018041 RepID=UPI000A0AA861|nr:hypothetical protein [Rhodococcus sp. 1168]ORI25619.1 hypothetical protein BJI47_03135 [Rhodococcus sp. 1168]